MKVNLLFSLHIFEEVDFSLSHILEPVLEVRSLYQVGAISGTFPILSIVCSVVKVAMAL